MENGQKISKLVWKKEYESGLVYLDNHRRNFLDILNELIEVVNEKSCETRLPMIFHRLAFYVEDYFTKKEMAIKDCDNLPLHTYKAEHDRFTSAIQTFQEEFRHGNITVCRELLEFLLDWFENYVKIFGSKEAEYMRSAGFE